MTIKVELYAFIYNPESSTGQQWVKPGNDRKRN
jgi:hypothetical protein